MPLVLLGTTSTPTRSRSRDRHFSILRPRPLRLLPLGPLDGGWKGQSNLLEQFTRQVALS